MFLAQDDEKQGMRIVESIGGLQKHVMAKNPRTRLPRVSDGDQVEPLGELPQLEALSAIPEIN